MLKLVFACIFSLITFFGVVSQASSPCSEGISSAEGQIQCYQHTDMAPYNNQNSDCHHSASSCHNCHLGHCSFTLGSSVYFALIDPASILNSTNKTTVISDFQTNPFRPPIN